MPEENKGAKGRGNVHTFSAKASRNVETWWAGWQQDSAEWPVAGPHVSVQDDNWDSKWEAQDWHIRTTHGRPYMLVAVLDHAVCTKNVIISANGVLDMIVLGGEEGALPMNPK